LQIHELAKIFPDMTPEEFNDLKEDIKQNSQLNPIITYEGAVIDGKNRLKALTELKIDPIFQEFEGDPEKLLDYVISQNLKRRHLNSSQRAVVAQKSLKLLKAQAKKRQGQRNDLKPEDAPPPVRPSAETAADMYGTNRKYVNDVQKIQEKAPELIKEIESGKKTVTQVLKVVKEKEEAEAAANRDDEQTRRAFWRLYTSKHQNRISPLRGIGANINNFPEFNKKMVNDFASILKSYKTHNKDLETILLNFQTTNGNGQPNHEPFNDTINKCNNIITFLKKIILLYEAANENVQFYTDNRDTLNRVYEKEAKKIIKEFKPIWKIVYRDDEDMDKEVDYFDTDDINKVKSVMETRIPDATCTKAVATVKRTKPDLNTFNKQFVKIKEFKHDPITILPKNGEKYLKKPESKPEKTAMDAVFG